MCFNNYKFKMKIMVNSKLGIVDIKVPKVISYPSNLNLKPGHPWLGNWLLNKHFKLNSLLGTRQVGPLRFARHVRCRKDRVYNSSKYVLTTTLRRGFACNTVLRPKCADGAALGKQRYRFLDRGGRFAPQQSRICLSVSVTSKFQAGT